MFDFITLLAGIRIGLYWLLAYLNWRWDRRLVALIFLLYSFISFNSLFQATHGGQSVEIFSSLDAAILQTVVSVLWLVDLARARHVRWILRGKI